LQIELLEEDEAWKLFKNVAGPIAERSDLQPTAEKVAPKCARLPIAIATVAKALKHKENLYEWEDALEMELSETFLLCCIMGHNAATEELLKYRRGLGLFRGLDTVEKVRRRVLTLVSELKDSSLVLSGSSPEQLDMHDVVCEVAIAIAFRDRGWLASGKEEVSEEWSDKDRMRTCSLVSLQNTKVSELLDERYSDVRRVNLEILDLRKSTIRVLPKEIGQLRRLKLLDLSGCFNLKVISPNVLSSLSRLEELYLYGCFNRWDWEVEGSENNPRSNASLVELQSLSRLTTL
ncbi:hypothetical protein Goklo_021142, partial [Gossypium klotzschianum]|nr:hypothetical protein [Gossypium klotzschianum]